MSGTTTISRAPAFFSLREADASHLHEIRIECVPCAGTAKSDDRGDEEKTSLHALPNDIEFSGEKEGAQRLTPSPLQ